MALPNKQTYLISGEDTLLRWIGNIQIGEETQESEFIATNHRLIYNRNGMLKDIGYDRISSLEIGTGIKTETSYSETKMALASMGSGLLAFLLGTAGGLSVLEIFAGYIIVVLPIAYLWIRISGVDFEGEEKVIYHVRIVRENEPPLHIVTEDNVGTELNRIVREAQNE